MIHGLKTKSFAMSRLLLFWEVLIRQKAGDDLSELSWKTSILRSWDGEPVQKCVKLISVCFAFILMYPSSSVFCCFWILVQLRKSKLAYRIQKVGRRQRWWIIRVFCKCTQVLSKIAVHSEICQNVYSAAVLAGSQTLALTQCSTKLSKSNSLGRFALSVGFINSSPQRAEPIL